MEEMKSHHDYLRALLYATGTDDGAWREIARKLCRGAQSHPKRLKKVFVRCRKMVLHCTLALNTQIANFYD